jgi:hypothetical protein
MMKNRGKELMYVCRWFTYQLSIPPLKEAGYLFQWEGGGIQYLICDLKKPYAQDI